MLLLCDAICNFASEILSQIDLPGKETPCSVNVLAGWLPPKRAGAKEEEDFPFVRVIPLEGGDSSTLGICTVSLLVGTWADDPGGWRDCVNVIQRIRLSLLALPGRTLAGRYRMTEKDGQLLTWRIYEDQPYPQWFGEITSHFSIPAMVPGLSDEEADLYGEGYPTNQV